MTATNGTRATAITGCARVRLGRTDLLVRPVGLGCMGMSQSYGPADDAESIATVRGRPGTGHDCLSPFRSGVSVLPGYVRPTASRPAMPVGRFGSCNEIGVPSRRVVAGIARRAGPLIRGRAGPRLAEVSVPRRQVIERVSSARPFRARKQRAMCRVSLEVVIGRLYRPALRPPGGSRPFGPTPSLHPLKTSGA